MMSNERESEAWRATGEFNRLLIDGGHFVYANGISEPSQATLVDNREGAGKVSNEMYIKGTAYLGGFWIVNFNDDVTALQWAHDASKACNQTVEVRRLHG